MSFKDTPLKDLPTSILIERVAEGWSSSHAGIAQEFVQRFAGMLKAQVQVKRAGENTLSFVSNLAHIRMRAMHNVPCWLVGGDATLNGQIREFWGSDRNPKQLPFILAFSERAYEQVQSKLPIGRCLRLSRDEIKELFRSPDPIQLLKKFIWRQIPRRALIPYNINLPAKGGMFFGRGNEVSRLVEETQSSFAIAGPGRIGKTSLLRRYRAQSLREHAERSGTRFLISLYDAKPATAARFLAMRIDPSSRSDRITADDLISFFKYQKGRRGAPLELLLDEVDGVCRSDAFKALAEAAKNELCRLVMCGRGELLKSMLDRESPLQGRAELIRVEPLEPDAAKSLIQVPLNDLGFTIEEPAQLVGQLLSLTGRLPHLIQHMCKALVEAAIDEKSDTITLRHLGKVKADFLTAEFFVNSIRDLTDPKEQLVALRLVAGSARRFTTEGVQKVAREENLALSFEAAHSLCNNLVINNVLAWDSGSYTLANEGLPFFAQLIGYLDGALADARAATKSAA